MNQTQKKSLQRPEGGKMLIIWSWFRAVIVFSLVSVAAARPHAWAVDGWDILQLQRHLRRHGSSWTDHPDPCGKRSEGQMEKPWRWGADTCWRVRVLWVVFPLPNLLCILKNSISPRIDCLLLLSSATIYHTWKDSFHYIAFILTHFNSFSLSSSSSSLMTMSIPSLYRVCAAGKVS